MGCYKYHLQGIDYPIMFSEMNEDIGCLCTFPHNHGSKLDPETVRSLAYLGATVAMIYQGEQLPHGFIPSCLPDWVKNEIDRVVLNK
jgi:hypothetical protein